MHKSRLLAGPIVLSLLCGISIRTTRAQDTSTPDERNQWAAISHQLESNPLDETTGARGDTAVHRIIHVQDFHVDLCQGFFDEFRGLDYTYHHQILRQYLLATAAFQVENPDKPGDEKTAANLTAANQYAIRSVLKSYRAILSLKPDARTKVLDDLEKSQDKGKLDDEVEKKCHAPD